MEKKKFNMTWVEILLVIVFLVILASILWPVFAKSSGHNEIRNCCNNLRCLSSFSMLYAQDHNNRMPGLCDEKSKKYVGWVNILKGYYRNISDGEYSDGEYLMYNFLYNFSCNKYMIDNNVCAVSYGYNAALIKSDRMGISEKNIIHPTKVGIVCDAGPLSFDNNQGGIIGSKSILNNINAAYLMVKPAGRHYIGYVAVGYADGHAQLINEVYNENDMENKVNKAFYRAVELGYIKNKVKGK